MMNDGLRLILMNMMITDDVYEMEDYHYLYFIVDIAIPSLHSLSWYIVIVDDG